MVYGFGVWVLFAYDLRMTKCAKEIRRPRQVVAFAN